jgi:hypothetical protein
VKFFKRGLVYNLSFFLLGVFRIIYKPYCLMNALICFFYQAVMLLGLIFSVTRLYLWSVVWLYDNEKIDIITKVHNLLGYRAHDDQKNLFNFVKLFNISPCIFALLIWMRANRSLLNISLRSYYQTVKW